MMGRWWTWVIDTGRGEDAEGRPDFDWKSVAGRLAPTGNPKTGPFLCRCGSERGERGGGGDPMPRRDLFRGGE